MNYFMPSPCTVGIDTSVLVGSVLFYSFFCTILFFSLQFIFDHDSPCLVFLLYFWCWELIDSTVVDHRNMIHNELGRFAHTLALHYLKTKLTVDPGA